MEMNSNTGTVFVMFWTTFVCDELFGLKESLYGRVMSWVSVLNKSSFGFENESRLHRILFFSAQQNSLSFSIENLFSLLNTTPLSYETVLFCRPLDCGLGGKTNKLF